MITFCQFGAGRIGAIHAGNIAVHPEGRLDPHFARLEREIRAGRIGRPEFVTIKSYDPAPPAIEFVRRSGGVFRDMMIHDLDMACWLLAEEPVEIFARGSVLVDPAIGAA